MWAALSTAQRAKAIQRMTSLKRWLSPDTAIDVGHAAADAGVSVTRMYEMGKAWRGRRSLASLGTFAAAPKTRIGGHDALIRKALGPVFDADPGGSVRKLALDLEAAIGAGRDDVPSHNTLRRYVERERRRRERETQAGNDVQLDCSACALTPSDDAMTTTFVILDRGTQVILGAALGDPADSRGGYARAARDARRRLAGGRFAKLRWVEAMARCEVVAGTDVDALVRAGARMKEVLTGVSVEISTRENRFGRYLRPATGLRIGTVVLMPTRTAVGAAAGDGRGVEPPTADQEARLSVEVDDYNAEVMSQMKHSSDEQPPIELARLLDALAGR